eukprot:TRINITY_DN7290_c0_g1_i4.p1 TRINITY_DN7290_c0_g1~~TRINITY_DN7290_c0_g1_i4.p1  ORF type:complete len:813 (-),score=156.30 TRINITY_DN7290_c0_g1_i4:100-2538(-)
MYSSSTNSSSRSSPILSLSPQQSSSKESDDCADHNNHPVDTLSSTENATQHKDGEKAGTLLSMAVDKILSKQEEDSVDVMMEGFMISKKGKLNDNFTSPMSTQISPCPSHNQSSISSVNSTPTVIRLPPVSSTSTSPLIAPSPTNFDREIVPLRLSLMKRSPSTILNPLPLPPTKIDGFSSNCNSNRAPRSSCGYGECSVCLNGTPPGFNNSPYPTWADICYTALYVLTINFPEQKFFHIKKDICKYIDAHFEVLCLRERTAIWKQTVNMTLSHPQYFKMFQQESALENGRKGYYGLKFMQDPYSVPEKPKKLRKRKSTEYHNGLSSDADDEFPLHSNWVQENQNTSPHSPSSPCSPNLHNSTTSTPRMNDQSVSPWFMNRSYSNSIDSYNTRSHSRPQTVEKEFNEQGERKKVDFPFSKSNMVDIPRINSVMRPSNQLADSEINKDTSKPSAFSPFSGKRDREKMQALEEEVFLFLASKLNRSDEEETENELSKSGPRARDSISTQQSSESNEDFNSLKIDEDSNDSDSDDSPSMMPQQVSPSWGMSNMSLHSKGYNSNYNHSLSNNNIYPSSSFPSPLAFNSQFRATNSPPQNKWSENRTHSNPETFLAGPPKRARKTTKPEEKTILEEYYLEHNGKSRHTRSELESLANRIHWKISRIQRWLDNRRTKEKLLNITKSGKKKNHSPTSPAPTRQIMFEHTEQKSISANQTIAPQLYPISSFNNRLSPVPHTTTMPPFALNEKPTVSKVISYPTYSINTAPQARSFDNVTMWPPYKVPFDMRSHSNNPLGMSTDNFNLPFPKENQAQFPSA